MKNKNTENINALKLELDALLSLRIAYLKLKVLYPDSYENLKLELTNDDTLLEHLKDLDDFNLFSTNYLLLKVEHWWYTLHSTVKTLIKNWRQSICQKLKKYR